MIPSISQFKLTLTQMIHNTMNISQTTAKAPKTHHQQKTLLLRDRHKAPLPMHRRKSDAR